MRVPAPGGVGEHSGAWRAASAAQATRRKKSTSFWSRIFIPITSAVSPLRMESVSFQMPMFTSRRPKATFGCRRKSLPRRRRMRNRSSRVRKPSQRRTSRPVSGTERIVDGMQLVPLPGHTPGHTGYEFSSKGQKILFWGDIVHAQRVQLQHPEVTAIFDIDQTAAAATRNQLLPELAREDVLIAGPHMPFPALGRLRKEASGYSWVPVIFNDRFDEQASSPQK